MASYNYKDDSNLKSDELFEFGHVSRGHLGLNGSVVSCQSPRQHRMKPFINRHIFLKIAHSRPPFLYFHLF